jgi:hypothetical protein
MGATGPGRRQRRSRRRLCAWSKASRSRERVPTTGRRRESAVEREGGVAQGRGGKAHGVPNRVTGSGDVARLAKERSDAGPLRAGSKAPEGRNAWWGVAVAATKHHEPHDWKPGATPGQGRGGASRRGGARPRGRRTRRVGSPSPTWHGDVSPDVDSSAPETVEGRSLETRTRHRTASQEGGVAGNRGALPERQERRSDPRRRSAR